MNRLNKPGQCSRKANQKNMESARNLAKPKCINCSSKNCKGNKYCPVHRLEYFVCCKKRHLCGAKACKQQRKYKVKHQAQNIVKNQIQIMTSSRIHRHSTESSTLDTTIFNI